MNIETEIGYILTLLQSGILFGIFWRMGFFVATIKHHEIRLDKLETEKAKK